MTFRKFALLAIALICLAGSSSQTAQPTDGQVRIIGDQAIAALATQNKIVVINFWATWCEPCVEEIPVLIKLHKQYSKVKWVGISMDDSDQQAEVQKFAAAHHMDYELYLRNGSKFEDMVNSMDPDWIGGLPATFVFRDGKRVYSKVGEITQQELEHQLRTLLE
ncbi:MAG TPA: TlpA disulfide reductase family protein [Acidobacteriota bacterium]|nr:TlpA disulfide reductase family protein [Acidobacteriota bacterium]